MQGTVKTNGSGDTEKTASAEVTLLLLLPWFVHAGGRQCNPSTATLFQTLFRVTMRNHSTQIQRSEAKLLMHEILELARAAIEDCDKYFTSGSTTHTHTHRFGSEACDTSSDTTEEEKQGAERQQRMEMKKQSW